MWTPPWSDTASGEIFSDSWELSVFLSGKILSREEENTLRMKYASGVSREFIPYTIFGSGTFQIATLKVRVWWYSHPYVPLQEIQVDERFSQEYKNYIQWQQDKQIVYYNEVFWKTVDATRVAEASSGFLCWDVSTFIAKTDGIFGINTEMTAIWGIPVETTPLSEQFPLLGSAIILQDEWWDVFTDPANIFKGYYWSHLPTQYGDIVWKYFIFSVSRDGKNIPYTWAINGNAISESEWIYSTSLDDCTIQSNNLPTHFTIHLLPPTWYTWSGQTMIDYRPLVKKWYSLEFSSGSWKLEHVLITKNSGEVFDISFDDTLSCNDRDCRMDITPAILQDIMTIELFYNQENE